MTKLDLDITILEDRRYKIDVLNKEFEEIIKSHRFPEFMNEGDKTLYCLDCRSAINLNVWFYITSKTDLLNYSNNNLWEKICKLTYLHFYYTSSYSMYDTCHEMIMKNIL